MGVVQAIYIAPGKRQPVTEVTEAELAAGKGIVGDRYHILAEEYLAKGLTVPANHISFVDAAELDEFQARHGLQIDHGEFRRSVITNNVDLNDLVGKQFQVGDAICYGEEPCEPCSYLARTVHQSVLPELKLKAGLRATVVDSGAITTGSVIKAL